MKGTRRWFSDEEMDLIVWYDAAGAVAGFELCYDKSRTERAVTWKKGGTACHSKVDGGESSPLRNDTPILVPAPPGDCTRLLADFKARSAAIEPALVEVVRSVLGAIL